MAMPAVMSRTAGVPSSRLALAASIWRPTAPALSRSAERSKVYQRRWFADGSKGSSTSREASILSSDPAFLPGSQSAAAPKQTQLPPGTVNSPPGGSPTPATPASSASIPPDQVPLVPPSPNKVQTAPRTSIPPSGNAPSPVSHPSSSAPPPKRKRRGLRFLLYLTTLGGLSYAGAVFYALQSDNFHDFFTEYVPFGEEAVLYFEERSFQKRFPNARTKQSITGSSAQRDGNKVTIPSKSGISWKVSDEADNGSGEVTQKGRHMSALDANQTAKGHARHALSEAGRKEKSATVGSAKGASAAPEKKPAKTAKPAPVAPTPTSSPEADIKSPVLAPVSQLSPLEVANAEEPLVQQLAGVVNDLITVINADSAEASNKYSAPISKAKEALVDMGAKINGLKQAERQAAQGEIQEAHRQFDESAKELARRIDAARNEEVAQYREEFESEKEKLSRSYSEKLKTDVERAQSLSEQRIRNQLIEQAIELKRKFSAEIKSLVEEERQGRLSKISELNANVNDLQNLTSDWNGVIDSNLATQKLQVAIDAVRSSISRATGNEDKPRPFLRELAALKEVADGDPIVDAAIASIDPTAYQRGIPSPAQLVDRFRRVSSEVRKASLLPEDAGVASHAASYVLSRIMFKKQGQPQGADVESVLTRTETLLEEGDLDSAAREMNTLQGWAGVLSKDWLQECRKVLEVRQALDVIQTEARLQCLRVD